MKLSRKLASSLRVASVLALGVALVPLLSSPAFADSLITQVAPFQNTTTTTLSSAFKDALAYTGGDLQNPPDVTFSGGTTTAPSGATNDLVVSSSGAISTSGALLAGRYTASGTDADSDPTDAGTWSYLLTVNPVTIDQISPTSNSTTPSASLNFQDQLETTGIPGAVSFTTTIPSDPSGLLVNSSGEVTTTETLAPGSYTVSGTDSDNYGDTSGSWMYSLTVGGGTITQIAPTSNTTSTTSSANFTDTLATTGGTAPVTFDTIVSAPAGLSVNTTTGVITTTGPLAAGAYTVSGNDFDSENDTGTWTYTLTVDASTITQAVPTSGTTATASSANFSAQLEMLGAIGPVSFVTPTPSSALSVSSSGEVTVTGKPEAGTYTVSGTDSDGFRDTGIWSYSLTLTASSISQSAPRSNSVTPAASASFTQQLTTSGGTQPVKFVTVATTESNGATTGLRVSSSGVVSTTGALVAGSYTASGTDSDTLSDTGKWNFTLTVTRSAITQAGPFSNGTTVTVSSSSTFTAQLKTTDKTSKVTFAVKGSGSSPPGFVVSSSGLVSTKGALASGTYTASGTDSDRLGDLGAWSFTLTITPTKITQVASTSDTVATGKPFTDQLKVSGSYGAVTYTQTTGKPSLTVSAAGVVSAPASLAGGRYRATGTASDRYGDTRGAWTFSLTVSSAKLIQVGPSTAEITPGGSLTAQLKVSGARGSVTFAQSTGAPHLRVSVSGAVSAQADLPKGTYTASGTDSDALGDTGYWSFTLSVTSVTIRQVGTDSAVTPVGKAFSYRIDVSGFHGRAIYSQSTGAPALKVSSSGAISAPATLAAGTYKATGTVTDTTDDSGTWSFTLKVIAGRLVELGPTTASTTTGRAFLGRVKLGGSHGNVTFSQSSGAPHLKISSFGVLSATGSLAAGTYSAKGSARDAFGDAGNWNFMLRVEATRIVQAVPVAARITVARAFSTQLVVSGWHGTVFYTESKGAPRLTVSSSGRVSAPASLLPGTYRATGDVHDTLGDGGTWGFALTVVGQVLVQAAPDAAKSRVGTAFKGRLAVLGKHGKITYSQSSGARHLRVSSSGVILAPATLATGTYKATGTMRGASGAVGSWKFTLTVVKGPAALKLIQVAPIKATTATGKAFADQLKVSGARGKVTFTQVTGAQVMTVSSTGKISAPATLAAATYVIQGTVKDATGDTGTWTFTLVVAAVVG